MAAARRQRRPNAACLSLGALALICLPALAHARIINVQALAGAKLDEGLSGKVALSGSLTTGNVLLVQATGSGTAFFRAGDNLMMLTLTGNYANKGTDGELGEEPFRENVFEHLRYRRRLSQVWSAEAFVQHEYDRWRRLRLRGLVGGGARADIATGEDSHLAVGLAYMAQVEELLDPQPGDLPGTYLEHRASSYLSASARISASAAISGTVYVQPNLLAPRDVRGLVELTFTVAVTAKVALTAGWSLAWDTAPPVDVRGLDSNTTLGLAWTI